MHRLRAHVGRIALDPNVRLKLWESPVTAAASINAAISACDILLPSTEDLAWLLQADERRNNWNFCGKRASRKSH